MVMNLRMNRRGAPSGHGIHYVLLLWNGFDEGV